MSPSRKHTHDSDLPDSIKNLTIRQHITSGSKSPTQNSAEKNNNHLDSISDKSLSLGKTLKKVGGTDAFNSRRPSRKPLNNITSKNEITLELD